MYPPSSKERSRGYPAKYYQEEEYYYEEPPVIPSSKYDKRPTKVSEDSRDYLPPVVKGKAAKEKELQREAELHKGEDEHFGG